MVLVLRVVGIQQNLNISHLIKFGNDDTVAARDVRTGGWRDASTHRFTILIEPPLGIRARNEATLSIPSSNPVDTVVEQEETKFLRLSALVQWSREPAASLFEFRLEHISVEDATVDECGGYFFFKVGIVTLDKVPSTTGEEFVSSWDRSLPVLFSVGVVVDAITMSEPVCGATEGAQAEERVWGHGRSMAVWLTRVRHASLRLKLERSATQGGYQIEDNTKPMGGMGISKTLEVQ